MRKRRILSLLLAVAVMATMIMAVPLTASAASTVFDFASQDMQTKFGTSAPQSTYVPESIQTGDITINMLSSDWYINTSYGGLTSNTNPQGQEKSAEQNASTNKVPSAGNVIKLNFAKSGSVNMGVRTNTGKTTYVCSFPAQSSTGTVVLKTTPASADTSIEFKVETNTDYYVYTDGSKLTYKNITFLPEGEEVSLTIKASSEKVYVGAPITLTASLTGSEEKVEWSVDAQKATLEPNSKNDKEATFKGKSSGTITVKASAGTASATCDIQVLNVPNPDTTVDAGGVNDLEAAKTTTTYDLLDKFYSQLESGVTASEVAAYNAGNLYFNKQIAVVGTSSLYYSNKSSYKIDGSKESNKGGIRLKQKQDIFALKLAAGSTVKVDIAGGGGGDRYGVITEDADYANDDTHGGFLVKSENLGSSNGKLPDNHQLLTYKNESGAEKVIYITATGDSFISQIQVIVPPKFGDTGFDSGYYYTEEGQSEENKRGVIRFFQSFAGQSVDDYGFAFFNNNGDSENGKARISKGFASDFASDDGFYGDLFDIVDTSTTVYAKGYVEINGETFFSPTLITGTVKDVLVEYPEQ